MTEKNVGQSAVCILGLYHGTQCKKKILTNLLGMMIIQHATAVYIISVQDKQCHIKLNLKGSNSNY